MAVNLSFLLALPYRLFNITFQERDYRSLTEKLAQKVALILISE